MMVIGLESSVCKYMLSKILSNTSKRQYMKVKASTLPENLLNLIRNPDPLEGEDIQIENEDGSLLGVIIQPKAYDFFLKKVEEREDEIDSATSEPYSSDSKSLDDLLGEG